MMSESENNNRPNGRLLYKPREAAEILAISERTLWQLANDGEIPVVWVGGKIRQVVRYARADLEAWIASRKQRSKLEHPALVPLSENAAI